MFVATLTAQALAAPFVVFPKAGRLVSPDGRFVVHDADREAAAADFVGTFHSLWLTEVATGRSRKLCDYLGVAAVAWSDNDFLVITQYVGKKSSRALVLSVLDEKESVMIDSSALVSLVPGDLRAALLGNDHVFIEASRLAEETFHFQVWGYGMRDPKGFRWKCQYGLREGNVACVATSKPAPRH